MKTVEVTLKLVVEFEDDNAPSNDSSLKDRIESDLFDNLDRNSSFQAHNDEDYNFEYKSLKAEIPLKSNNTKLRTDFEIGDTVKIKRFGNIYTSYYKKFLDMGFKDPDNVKGIYNDSDKFKNTEFKIFAIGKHDEERVALYGIEDTEGNQFLFSKSGIKLIKQS